MYYKNLETGVIWSTSNLDHQRNLNKDENYIIIQTIKGAANDKVAAPSIVPEDPIYNSVQDPEDLIINDGPDYNDLFQKELTEDQETILENGPELIKKPKRKYKKRGE